MNRSLTDTDILSYFLKGNKQVTENFELYLKEYPRITISEITYFEILAGLTLKEANKQIEKFEIFISTCQTLKLTSDSIKAPSKIYAELRRKGIIIGTTNLLIFGIAII